MTEPMSVRVRVRAPIADVWHALTDPAALRVWLAEHAEVDLPARYQFWGRYTPEGDVPRQRLLQAEDHTLRFAWTLADTETIVEIRLAEESASATFLTLSQTGLPGYAETVAGVGTLSLVHTFWALAIANLAEHAEGREPTLKCDFTTPETREQLIIGATPEAVYSSLIDPEAFAQWFGARIEVEPHVGGRWAMGGFDMDETPAKILELEPDHQLSLGWDNGMTASWELAESDGKTRLTFVQSGFDDGRPSYDSWLGWLSGFVELRRFHEIEDWRPMWLDVQLAGLPDGLLTIHE
ncbi:SRPBCC family protein [Amycolatopsis sp. H20-H5]|uniref:SRPBCC family protein n=1 Tax=Amycolatopsis sp. H20-H5 TaxID=3046309 RepID=UPI002DB69F8B|nr:SRPBCC family protein [Amycolatopsis sp. H20-H5]MEC3979466.1 SRPBCC family protein [Amycolatopsis sp. H20-H5]